MNGATSTISPEQTAVDPRDQFAQKLMATLNSAGLAMMISIGHRTRLFDVMAGIEPASSHEIAQRAELKERYVREWLGAMVTGGVVEFDPDKKTYLLPRVHASLLTRASTPENFAVTMQWIAVLGRVEDEIVEAFQRGGGVPYEAFHRFHEVMREESAQTVVATLLEHILPLEPRLEDRLHEGVEVLDIGCGAGRAVMRLAEAFPRSRFAGYDLCADAVAMARADAAKAGLQNVRFEVRNVAELDEPSRYHLITAFDAIHDQADPAAVLRAIHRSLQPDGLFLMQDIDSSSHLEKNCRHPLGTFLYTISCMHCMTVSLAQGGAGLGTCWGVELAQKMLREAGFSEIQTHRLPHDVFNCFFVVEP
ncbi:MAG: class I SAM-dependent methyltransferase [Pirellulales bacterium]|nr:class I SAM-dependent methyltransferase [Pirellulales bacterium]